MLVNLFLVEEQYVNLTDSVFEHVNGGKFVYLSIIGILEMFFAEKNLKNSKWTLWKNAKEKFIASSDNNSKTADPDLTRTPRRQRETSDTKTSLHLEQILQSLMWVKNSKEVEFLIWLRIFR